MTNVVFDQSLFVRTAIENLIHEGGIGLVLTGHDSDFSRQHARDRGGVSLDSAVGAGCVHRAVYGRQHRSTRWFSAVWRWPSRA